MKLNSTIEATDLTYDEAVTFLKLLIDQCELVLNEYDTFDIGIVCTRCGPLEQEDPIAPEED